MLCSAIELLPPFQREAIVLTHFQDLSGADMAEVMGVDIETAKGG
jgi:DNA-directed RNA polymerase specialized sigma24 family protein